MSYPNSNWNAGGEGYNQWPAQTGWNQDPNTGAYFPPNTGYPPAAYNQAPGTGLQGQQYADPRNTVYSPGYPQQAASPYGNYNGYQASSASQHQPYPYPSSGSSSSPYGSPAAPPTIQLTEGPPPTPSGGQRSCSHCGATSTPVWRRDPKTHAPLCNACGVYLSTRRAPRPQALIDVDREQMTSESDSGDPSAPSCSHCGTRKTSVWRRNKAGAQICNACGVYERMNGRPRPLELRNDKVRPREKHRG
ncbi:Gata zinc finger domain-containing protein [Mycena indigotica]|uniref:Gata zinc finger domain-containing protein n=1 Tax=Mycena indigotica TaxID=2126181 RepID=A0A8H6T1M3_9AGAR|nr:Gata zinc finger domain-containing protein [Mycena indigotica]KAF7309259.1 Gata zinc finger domain-containing protein [Mycena indigotica]